MKSNNNKALWYITSAALAGFLFGFDTVVISGANQPIKDLWHTSPLFHGTFIMSMALWGTVLGSIGGGIPCERWGRKPTLILIGWLYLISAVGSALAPDPYSFSFFRFVGGLGIGISSVVAPTYISEITSAANRGRMVALYQFNLVFGILVAFISNYLLSGFNGENDWRWMLGVEGIPAFVYCIMVMMIPESPRWLIVRKNNIEKAREILISIQGEEKADSEIKSITEHSEQSKGKVSFNWRHLRKPLSLAFLLSFFNQLSGINFILYYAPEILERAGLATRDSLQSSISIGFVNFVFTLFGMYLIDKLGRKKLLFYGSIGYILSLILVGMAFQLKLNSIILLSSLCLFIASHAIGQGAVLWVYIAEIFPNRFRSYGQSFGTGVHWVFAALITLLTPLFLDKDDGVFGQNPAPIFFFFAALMVLQLLWVIFIVPETKGVSLEELQDQMEVRD
ncbi:MAG: sugar porter family MFS transporter [Bacteroidetes bacterium]|nr:sugar porter family MFS transporter [Bacteroidota bacterium]